MPDATFADPRLAAVYDAFDSDRSDLVHYRAMVEEFAARRVLDIGSGTGCLAVLLAADGIDVVGVDPAVASIEVARRKPHGDQVTWVEGTAPDALEVVAGDPVDLVVMTGNVAQVFLSDDDWTETLRAARAALRTGGRLVFETRDPAQQAWLGWTRDQTHQEVEVEGWGRVESWCDVTALDGEFVTFTGPMIFHDRLDDQGNPEQLVSSSTLRFRSRAVIEAQLEAVGFGEIEVRDAPDRPGLEFVFVATKV